MPFYVRMIHNQVYTSLKVMYTPTPCTVISSNYDYDYFEDSVAKYRFVLHSGMRSIEMFAPC